MRQDQMMSIEPDGRMLLMTGNEAMARGAIEAGLSLAAGYPGTPSSEILENLAAGYQTPDKDLLGLRLIINIIKYIILFQNRKFKSYFSIFSWFIYGSFTI